jgi:hypothetical protein
MFLTSSGYWTVKGGLKMCLNVTIMPLSMPNPYIPGTLSIRLWRIVSQTPRILPVEGVDIQLLLLEDGTQREDCGETRAR